MRLIVRQDYDEVSAYAGNEHDWTPDPSSLTDHGNANRCLILVAYYVKERIRQFQPSKDRLFVMGLPTGSSPIGVYHKLVDFYKSGDVSFENVVTFNMDEYVGLPR